LASRSRSAMLVRFLLMGLPGRAAGDGRGVGRLRCRLVAGEGTEPDALIARGDGPVTGRGEGMLPP
jgi:hypothetical protein